MWIIIKRYWVMGLILLNIPLCSFTFLKGSDIGAIILALSVGLYIFYKLVKFFIVHIKSIFHWVYHSVYVPIYWRYRKYSTDPAYIINNPTRYPDFRVITAIKAIRKLNDTAFIDPLLCLSYNFRTKKIKVLSEKTAIKLGATRSQRINIGLNILSLYPNPEVEESLIKIGANIDQIIDAYLKAIQSEFKEVKEKAIHALHKFHNPKVIQPLLVYFIDKVLPVTEESLKNAGLNEEQIIEAYFEAMKSELYETKEKAIKSLHKYKNPKVFPLLLNYLADNALLETEVTLRNAGVQEEQIIYAYLKNLARYANPVVEEKLINLNTKEEQIIEAYFEAMKSEFYETKERAIRSLHKFSNPKVISLLLNYLADKALPETEVALKSSGANEEQIIEFYFKAINSNNNEVIERAAKALLQYPNLKILNFLKDLLLSRLNNLEPNISYEIPRTILECVTGYEGEEFIPTGTYYETHVEANPHYDAIKRIVEKVTAKISALE